MFIAAQLTISKWWKQPKCPSVNEWIKKLWYIYTAEILRSRKKGAPTLCNSMDGSGEHYAKWNKPGSEIQIPYDFTYQWNLITSKQNITRDIETKNNLTVTRGEMGGDNGGKRRVFRNNYKGHMDKTKGDWNQGREVKVGGKADNCTWTIIKF